MTATNHGLAGAVIAIALHKYPAAAVAAAPFSHFVLDALPHFGETLDAKSSRFLRRLALDMALAVAATLFIASLWPGISLLIIACAFLAASPDLMWLYYYYLRPTPEKKWGRLAKFHSRIQWSQTPPGIVVEAVWFAIIFPSLIVIGAST